VQNLQLFSAEQPLKNSQFKTIKNLLDDSTLETNTSFFTQLYTNSDFDNKFCSELTGYNKTAFTINFLKNSYNKHYIQHWVRDKLIAELLNIASKNNKSKDLQEIKMFICTEYPNVAPPTTTYHFAQKPVEQENTDLERDTKKNADLENQENTKTNPQTSKPR